MSFDELIHEWYAVYVCDYGINKKTIDQLKKYICKWARKQLPGKRQKRDHPLHVNQDKTWVSGYNHAIIEMEKKFK